MIARRLFATIGLAAGIVVVVGCASSKPTGRVPPDEGAAPDLHRESAGLPQLVPALATQASPSPTLNMSETPAGWATGGHAEHNQGMGSPGREIPSATSSTVDSDQSEVGTQTPPVPFSAVAGTAANESVQAPLQDAAASPETGSSASIAAGPASPATGDSSPTLPPLGPGVGETAVRKSVDAGWGPAPTKVGKLGVVKPATRPIDIDPTLVDAIKLPDGDPRREIIGIWEQIAGSNDADFAHGNYSKSVLTLRTDGVLDVARFYGPSGEVKVNRQLAYSIEAGKLLVASTQGAHATPTDLALAVGPNGTTVMARKPKSVLPLTVGYTAKEDSLVIDGRTYKRVPPAAPPSPQ